ncbi:helix-turn-helix transcriptional regulator [Adlercreutzia sp. ZJ138]|uniref:helix-turn-helix transcriptional regulator n=1 Tax=Adlercreutzia sp. ZJ138 TaxID=2709405 RepID=UPI0013EC8390|nr:helix-turn-helix transcriptional regulator [Adlercreutzia sp. ZJ138]
MGAQRFAVAQLSEYALPAVVGFACNQGFLFSLFYTGWNRAAILGQLAFERVDLFGALLCMTLSFAALHSASARARSAALSRPLLWCYAALAIVGSAAPVLFGDSVAGIALESALVGFSSGALLAAWGRAFSHCPRRWLLMIIVLGAGLGAVLCLIAYVVPASGAVLLLKLLPLGSVSALGCFPHHAHDEGSTQRKLSDALPQDHAAGLPFVLADLLPEGEQRRETELLTRKMLVGMAMFGLAAGLMETFGSDPGMASAPALPASLFMFILFVVATIQQVCGSAPQNVGTTDVLRRGQDASGTPGEERPLEGMYRLAMFVILAGFLLLPVVRGYGVPGEAIVLSGYLGLTYVLISLFVVMASVSEGDPALALARGFAALYAGEAAGIGVGNLIEWACPVAQTNGTLAACAGMAAVVSFLFLFTERDFNRLATIADKGDPVDESSRIIASEFGLSPREGEVLTLALRGRTSERIATELFISKSTVDTHLRRIYQKTSVHGRQGLIDLAERILHHGV